MARALAVAFSFIYLLVPFAFGQVDLSSKTQYYPNGLTDAFDLDDLLTSPSFTSSPVSDFSLCKSDTCDTAITAAYTVSYAGQGSSLVCFCDNPVMDLQTMAVKIGKVPVILRETVVSYTSSSVGKGGGAGTVGGQIYFLDSPDPEEVFIHESTHAFDGAHGGYSSQPAYYAALNADSCVPDGYASTNDVEDFAQLMVSWTYFVVSGTAIPSCLANSLAYLATVAPASAILASYSGNATSGQCPISVRQTLVTSWETNGLPFSQYDVFYTSNALSEYLQINAQVSGNLAHFWNIQSESDGLYHLPAFLSSGLAPGAQLQWGYIIQSQSAAVIDIVSPASCSSATPPSSTTGSPSNPGCQVTANLAGTFESLPTWSDGTYQYTQYTLAITNQGTSNVQFATVFIYFNAAYGTFSQQWNFDITSSASSGNEVDVTLFNLAPGQTFLGAGFIFQVSLANLANGVSFGNEAAPFAVRVDATQC